MSMHMFCVCPTVDVFLAYVYNTLFHILEKKKILASRTAAKKTVLNLLLEPSPLVYLIWLAYFWDIVLPETKARIIKVKTRTIVSWSNTGKQLLK